MAKRKAKSTRAKPNHLVSIKPKGFSALPTISDWKVFLFGALLFGAVLCVFLPATKNEFIYYDDTEYVTENLHVQGGLKWENFKWAFTSGYVNWHPLTWISHMADCEFYGLNAEGHHLTNVMLHALNAALLFLALQRMTGAKWRSLLMAAFFGLHPLRVESVAWVAERKDVLSGLFFMLTLLAYAEYVCRAKVQAPESKLFYVLALMTFSLGLMSKPMLVTVPFILLVLDWWPLKRISSFQFQPSAQNLSVAKARTSTPTGLVWEKAPFFLLATVLSIVTFEVQKAAGAVQENVSLFGRAENAVVSYCRYIGKLFWPVNLAVFYPPQHHWPMVIVLLCLSALVVVSIFVVLMCRRPYLAVGWMWYLGMLVPVIGLVQVGWQSMADRYTYLPTIGISLMVVWGLYDLASGRRNREIGLFITGGAVAVACAVLTWRQIGWWKDGETLFRRALAVTEKNTVALDNLGRALGQKGRLDEASEQYREALKLNPHDFHAHNGLGALLIQKDDYDGAAEQLEAAVKLNSQDGFTHANLGIVHAHKGLMDEAIAQLNEAVSLQTDSAEIQNDLAAVLVMQKRYNEAIPHYQAAVSLNPNYANAHRNLGVALAETGRLDEAIEQFREAIRLKPDFKEAQECLQETLNWKANPSNQGHPQ